MRAWLRARDGGREPSDGEVRGVWARMCRAWSRRAAGVRRRRPAATEEQVAAETIDDIIRDFAHAPETAALLTVAYGLLMIARGVFVTNCEHLFSGRASQTAWSHGRVQRAELVRYLAEKLAPGGRAPYPWDDDPAAALPSDLLAAVNAGSPEAAAEWLGRLPSRTGSHDRRNGVLAALRADGTAALAAYPGLQRLGRPEPGPPRGIWLSPSERAAAIAMAAAGTAAVTPPAPGGGGPLPPGGDR